MKNNEEEELKDIHEPVVYTSFRAVLLLGIEWLFVLIGALSSLGAGTIGALFVLAVGKLIDVLAPTNPIEPSDSPIVRGATNIILGANFDTKLNQITLEMGIYTIIGIVVNVIANWAFIVANDRIGMKLRNAYFGSLVKQEIGYFDITKSGKLVNHVTEDVSVIQDVLSMKLGKFCEFTSQCILALALALRTSWRLTLIVFAAAPGILIPVFGVAGSTELFKRLSNSSASVLISIVNEVVGGMRTVRSMSGEEKEATKYNHHLQRGSLVGFAKSITLAIFNGLLHSFLWGIVMLTFWYGGRLVRDLEITVGDLVLVVSLLLFGVLGSAQALTILPEFAKANKSAMSLLTVILRKPVIRFKGGLTPSQLTGNIDFKNISFAYPTRPNVKVLKNFSLSVSAGQNVALVGQSGSGKSTIVGLLERFYEAESGDVLVDGVNIKEIDPQWLHKHIGIVTQEPTLFATTIKKNITYAVSQYREVSDEEVTKAAKDANAHDFIISLPDGYNTMLGERGVSLSGGQKQRIAIARAMIQNPSVLLLDEATSALDTESESLVQDALSKLMKGRTSIVIAHRLSTIQNADVIVVMTRGEIVEMGTHNELIAKQGGVYAKLAAKQMKFGESSEEESDAETSESESLIPVVADEIDAHNL